MPGTVPPGRDTKTRQMTPASGADVLVLGVVDAELVNTGVSSRVSRSLVCYEVTWWEDSGSWGLLYLGGQKGFTHGSETWRAGGREPCVDTGKSFPCRGNCQCKGEASEV